MMTEAQLQISTTMGEKSSIINIFLLLMLTIIMNCGILIVSIYKHITTRRFVILLHKPIFKGIH